MGGSAYYRYLGLMSSCVPAVDLDLSKRAIEAMLELNDSEVIVSAHDLSEGGLGVAVAEMCIGGGSGAEILISAIGDFTGHERMRDDTRLFSESCSRYIVEVRLPNAGRVEDCLSRHDVPYVKLGTVIGENLTVLDGDRTLIDIPVKDLDRAWRGGLGSQLEGSS
jgi:phosphoribosylformylglycinamidine synthase